MDHTLRSPCGRGTAEESARAAPGDDGYVFAGVNSDLAGDELAPKAAPVVVQGGAPLISVVLATYNRAYVLEETLRMVFAQTLDDFELIVCDDGSTDQTPELIGEWAARDSRIRYVRQPRNLGGWLPNVRRGIALARAEFVAVPL